MAIDPAPPASGLFSVRPEHDGPTEENMTSLRSTLLDTKLPLFERYRAMFALRNLGTDAAVDALADGFSDDSALFRYLCPTFYPMRGSNVIPQARNCICLRSTPFHALCSSSPQGPRK